LSAVVLILEGSPELRRMLEETLRHRGYAVKSAADVEETLATLRKTRVDLLIADPPIPGAPSGTALLDPIQAEFPDLPAIVVSGSAFDPEGIRPAQPGAPRRRRLRRPFTLGEMLTLTESVLSGDDRR
jgi:DNA-binding NtrC family response regulator